MNFVTNPRGWTLTYTVLLVALILFAVGFKQLYIKMKKGARFAYYDAYANEVSDSVNRVAVSDNKSYIYVLRLNKLLSTTLRRNDEKNGES